MDDGLQKDEQVRSVMRLELSASEGLNQGQDKEVEFTGFVTDLSQRFAKKEVAEECLFYSSYRSDYSHRTGTQKC